MHTKRTSNEIMHIQGQQPESWPTRTPAEAAAPWQWIEGAAAHRGRCPPTTLGSLPKAPVLGSCQEAPVPVVDELDLREPGKERYNSNIHSFYCGLIYFFTVYFFSLITINLYLKSYFTLVSFSVHCSLSSSPFMLQDNATHPISFKGSRTDYFKKNAIPSIVCTLNSM